MGFFNTIKSMVGSGAPAIMVELKHTESKVGGIIKGVAHIKGGEYESALCQLDFYIVKKEEQKDGKEWKDSKEKIGKMTCNEYIIEKDEEIHIPFQVSIPKDTLITSQAIKQFIRVSLDIPGKDVFGETEIKIH